MGINGRGWEGYRVNKKMLVAGDLVWDGKQVVCESCRPVVGESGWKLSVKTN